MLSRRSFSCRSPQQIRIRAATKSSNSQFTTVILRDSFVSTRNMAICTFTVSWIGRPERCIFLGSEPLIQVCGGNCLVKALWYSARNKRQTKYSLVNYCRFSRLKIYNRSDKWIGDCRDKGLIMQIMEKHSQVEILRKRIL